MTEISACAIVRDEEANLPRWLACMKELADEVVVVDTGSTDRTREIAREAGVRLEHFPWRDDFAAAKNYALDCCRGKWIAMLDADEYFLPGDVPKVRQLVEIHHEDSSVLGFLFQRINIDQDNYGAYINSGPQIRLFRAHPRLRYHGRIHENLVYEGEGQGQMLFYPDAPLYHTGYSSSVMREKISRDLALLQREEEEGKGEGKEFYFADCYYGLRDYARAAEYAERGIRRGLTVAVGDDVRPFQIWIESLMLTGRAEEEIQEAVEKAKEVHPESPRFDFLLGFHAWDKEDYLEADRAFRRGMELADRRKMEETGFLGGTGQEKYLADACCKLARTALWRGRGEEAMEWTGKALAAEKYNVHALQIFLELLGSLSPADTIAMLNGVYDKKGDAPFLLRNLGMEKHRQVRLYYLRQAGVATDDFEEYWLAGRTMAAAASIAEDMDALCRRVLCEAKASGRMPEDLEILLPKLYKDVARGNINTPRKAKIQRSVERMKK